MPMMEGADSLRSTVEFKIRGLKPLKLQMQAFSKGSSAKTRNVRPPTCTCTFSSLEVITTGDIKRKIGYYKINEKYPD